MGVRTKMADVRKFFADNPDRAVGPDSPALAVVAHGLRAIVSGPNGYELVTGVSEGLGGDGSAPSAGWFHRASLAACLATQISLRAAEEEVDLEELEVLVESWSDARGMLGIDDASPLPTEVKINIKLSSRGSPSADVRAIADWALSTSTVASVYGSEVNVDAAIEIGKTEKPSRLSRRRSAKA